MSEADVEIQDELEEVQEEVQPTPEAEPQEESKPEIDFEDPTIKEAIRIQREKDQEAINKRISREVGKRKTIENQFSQVMEKVASLEKAVQKDIPEPKLENFETEQEFVSAMIDHKMGSQKPQAKPQQQQIPPSAIEMDFQRKEMEYAKTHPEYYNNLNNLNPFLTEDFKSCLYAAGPEVTDFLTQNLHEAEKISALPASVMGREIALLEGQFKREQPLPRKAKPKPAPATESTGGTSTSKDISGMSQAEYNRYMANPSKW